MSRQLLLVCFCIYVGEFVLFVWFGVVCLGLFLGGFVFVVKIVVTSLWAKGKGLFGCFILFGWMAGVFKKKRTKYHTNKTNPTTQKYSTEKEMNNTI